jgi:hypothetical protein
MSNQDPKKFTLIRRPVDPTRKRYYLVDDNYGSGWFEIVNKPDFDDKEHPDWPSLLWRAGPIEIREYAGTSPDGHNKYFGGWYGLPKLPTKPILKIKHKRGKELDAYGNINHPFISNRAKEFFERLDPDAFEFIECDAYGAKKESLPPYWMMAVKRVVKSFDVENSIFRDYGIKRPLINGYSATLTKLYDIRMSPDLPSNHHAFYLIHFSRMPVFDEILVDQWRESGFTGLFFNPLQPPTDEELKKVNQFYFHEYYYEEYRNFEVKQFAWGDLV